MAFNSRLRRRELQRRAARKAANEQLLAEGKKPLPEVGSGTISLNTPNKPHVESKEPLKNSPEWYQKYGTEEQKAKINVAQTPQQQPTEEKTPPAPKVEEQKTETATTPSQSQETPPQEKTQSQVPENVSSSQLQSSTTTQFMSEERLYTPVNPQPNMSSMSQSIFPHIQDNTSVSQANDSKNMSKLKNNASQTSQKEVQSVSEIKQSQGSKLNYTPAQNQSSYLENKALETEKKKQTQTQYYPGIGVLTYDPRPSEKKQNLPSKEEYEFRTNAKSQLNVSVQPVSNTHNQGTIGDTLTIGFAPGIIKENNGLTNEDIAKQGFVPRHLVGSKDAVDSKKYESIMATTKELKEYDAASDPLQERHVVKKSVTGAVIGGSLALVLAGGPLGAVIAGLGTAAGYGAGEVARHKVYTSDVSTHGPSVASYKASVTDIVVTLGATEVATKGIGKLVMKLPKSINSEVTMNAHEVTEGSKTTLKGSRTVKTKVTTPLGQADDIQNIEYHYVTKDKGFNQKLLGQGKRPVNMAPQEISVGSKGGIVPAERSLALAPERSAQLIQYKKVVDKPTAAKDYFFSFIDDITQVKSGSKVVSPVKKLARSLGLSDDVIKIKTDVTLVNRGAEKLTYKPAQKFLGKGATAGQSPQIGLNSELKALGSGQKAKAVKTATESIKQGSKTSKKLLFVADDGSHGLKDSIIPVSGNVAKKNTVKTLTMTDDILRVRESTVNTSLAQKSASQISQKAKTAAKASNSLASDYSAQIFAQKQTELGVQIAAQRAEKVIANVITKGSSAARGATGLYTLSELSQLKKNGQKTENLLLPKDNKHSNPFDVPKEFSIENNRHQSIDLPKTSQPNVKPNTKGKSTSSVPSIEDSISNNILKDYKSPKLDKSTNKDLFSQDTSPSRFGNAASRRKKQNKSHSQIESTTFSNTSFEPERIDDLLNPSSKNKQDLNPKESPKNNQGNILPSSPQTSYGSSRSPTKPKNPTIDGISAKPPIPVKLPDLPEGSKKKRGKRSKEVEFVKESFISQNVLGLFPELKQKGKKRAPKDESFEHFLFGAERPPKPNSKETGWFTGNVDFLSPDALKGRKSKKKKGGLFF